MSLKLFIGQQEIDLKIFKFPGGEINVQVLGDKRNPWGECKIIAKIRNSDDVMTLLLLTDACKRLWGKDTRITLVLPYIPYAQQDRVCNEGEALSIKVFADLINAQNYQEVVVYDPHSDVATALINNCTIVEQKELLSGISNYVDVSSTILAVPDAGAQKKAYKVMKNSKFADIIECGKIRDTQTGRIINTTVYATKEDIQDKDILVIDDICVGGRTFIELGKKLKELTNGKLYLYTTHGIYSNGCHELLKYYDHLFTVNSWADSVNEDFITILKVNNK